MQIDSNLEDSEVIGMNNNIRTDAAREFSPTLTDVNRARERQMVVDPEKGPQNKKRKRID